MQQKLAQLWFEYYDSWDMVWKVYLVDSDDPVLQENSAICYGERQEIYIRNDGDVHKKYILFVHEFLHSLLSAPGETKAQAKLFHTDLDNLYEREELIVSMLAPRLFSVLNKNRFLSIPNVPKQEDP